MKSQFRGFLFEAKHLTGLLVAAATVAVLLYMEVAAVGQSMGSALSPTPQAPGDNPTTPRRSLRDVPSSQKRLCGGPRPGARRDGHRPGQQPAASARQFDSDRQTQ